MAGEESEIVQCPACRAAMDVTPLGPFSNAECPTCGEHVRVKTRFGPYTLRRRYAIGGMSVVFVAHDETLDREVVVKILNEDYSADEKRIAAFEEEARITASINHPNVVRVLTTGRAFGRFFIAMEFVPGGHFEHHIREQGSIPEGEAVARMIEVAEGLKAAHDAGLIHRDVKPGNILLDGQGRAKLVDFGLALVTQGGKAKASEIWATPYYVPPEAIDGGEEDFRSDVYAFGATFYHALAGKPPCDEPSMDTKRLREAKRAITPLARAARQVGAELAEVIDRCMEYQPRDRYESYEELLAALRSLERPVAAANGRGRSGGRGSRRRRRPARRNALLALSLAAALLAAGVAAWLLGREAAARDEAERAASEEKLPATAATTATSGGAPVLVAARYGEAHEAMQEREFALARERFAEVRDDPEVLEPTASLAGCEMVIASLAAGRGDQARDDARAALAHVKTADELPRGQARQLSGVLREVRGLEPIATPDSFSSRPGVSALWLLAGLKNWEQGQLDRAEPFFTALVGLERNDPFLETHREIARRYLSDLERLRAAEPESFDLPREECQARIDELHALYASLETRGRARFNVRSWQLELERQMRRPPEPEPEPEPAVVAIDPGPLPEAIERDLAAARFLEASRQLKEWNPATPARRAEREALLSLSAAAASFVAELAERGAAADPPIQLSDRGGTRYAALLGGDASQAVLRDAGGGRVERAWGELDPASLIAAHRQLVRGESHELEVMRRHELALAFDLLSGDGERARQVAERLGESSDLFRRRWQPLLAALDEE